MAPGVWPGHQPSEGLTWQNLPPPHGPCSPFALLSFPRGAQVQVQTAEDQALQAEF